MDKLIIHVCYHQVNQVGCGLVNPVFMLSANYLGSGGQVDHTHVYY